MKKLCITAIAAIMLISSALSCNAAYGDIGIVAPVLGEEEIFFHTFDGVAADTGNAGEDTLNTAVHQSGTLLVDNDLYGSNCLLLSGINNILSLGQLEEGWYQISFMHRADWQNPEDTQIISPEGSFVLLEDGAAVDFHAAGTIYDSINISGTLQPGLASLGNVPGYTIYCARTNQEPLPVSIIFKATQGKNYSVKYGICDQKNGKNLYMLVDDIKLSKLRSSGGEPIIGDLSPSDLYNSSLTFSAAAYNNTGYTGSAVIISAVYNGDNTCVGLNSNTVEFTGQVGEAKNFRNVFNIGTTEDTSEYTVKTYVWDNTDLGNPLALVENGYYALNKNSGFEAKSGENSFANWQIVGDTTVEASEDSYSGKYCAKVTPNAGNGGITMGTIHSIRGVYGTGVYRLSAKVKAAGANATIALSGKYCNHDHNGVAQSISGTTVIADANSWSEISLELDEASLLWGNPDSSKWTLLNLTSDKPFLVDDFRLEKVSSAE